MDLTLTQRDKVESLLQEHAHRRRQNLQIFQDAVRQWAAPNIPEPESRVSELVAWFEGYASNELEELNHVLDAAAIALGVKTDVDTGVETIASSPEAAPMDEGADPAAAGG